MKRLNMILDHMQPLPTDCAELRSLKRRLELQSLRAHFVLSEDRLKEMAYFMIHEMQVGLADEKNSTLRMLPSFVYRKDVSNTTGIVYALDLGGTNFRVLSMKLHEGKLLEHSAMKFAIPEKAMHGTAELLFGFIAESIQKFETTKGRGANPSGRVPLGFTFSFPTQQYAINKGSLIAWTKGFTASGVAGKNLVELLQKELDSRNLEMDVVALCNDTVGTLVARYFADPNAEVGVILGTGSNACYWEKACNVTKNGDVAKEKGKEIVINMEFGNFDSKDLLVLPRTPFDEQIDRESPNPGAQRLEKMISGFYKGEIARLILLRLSKNGILPESFQQKLNKRNIFESKDVSAIIGDRLPGRHRIQTILRDTYGIDNLDLSHLHVVLEVCSLVCNRAAQLAGMAVGATLLKAGKQHNATVAIDGSVFEKTPTFKAIMERAVHQVVGPNCEVRLVLQRDGSGFGAGFIAALAK